MKYSDLRPSSSDRWLKCYASPILERQFPDTETIYNKLGVAAHKLCEISVKEGTTPDTYIGRKINNFTVDTDMAFAVAVYFQFINQLKNTYKKTKLKLEKKVSIVKGWSGTADCILLAKRVLYVIDYKHGSGVRVHPKNNSQLAFYGIAAIKAVGIENIDKLVLVIVQPRTGEDQSIKRITIEDPKAFYKKWMKRFKTAKKRTEFVEKLLINTRIEKLSSTQLDKCFATGEHCRFCKARSICPKLTKAMTALAKSDFDTSPGTSDYKRIHPAPNPNKLSPDQISEILHKANLVEMYIKAVKERALELMLEGIDIPGFKPVYGNTHRKWSDEKKTQRYLEKKLGDKAYSIRKLLTPTQAVKLVGKAYVKEHAIKPLGRPSIASNDDKRHPIRLKATVDFLE